jgi:transcriptional regulator with XRE-family HTH domain
MLEEKKFTDLFAKRLRRIRCEKQISQETLSKTAFLTPTYISKLESGTENPSLKTIVKLANSLEIHPAVFLFNDNDFEINKLLNEYCKNND